MLNRLPRHTPELAELLEDIGHKHTDAATVGRALGVSARTIQRWKSGQAPRMALLALWWLSREGRSAWDAECERYHQMLVDTNAGLWREVARLRAQIVGREVASLEGAAQAQAAHRWRRAKALSTGALPGLPARRRQG